MLPGKIIYRSPIKTMGDLTPRLCTLESHSSTPINMSEKMSAHKSVKSNLTSPTTPQNSYPKFRNHRKTFENLPLCQPKYISAGRRGFPKLINENRNTNKIKMYPKCKISKVLYVKYSLYYV